MVKPEKVQDILAKRPYTRGWYQLEMNLAEDGIVGPFDFETIDGERYRIGENRWTTLLNLSEIENVDTDDVNTRVPL